MSNAIVLALVKRLLPLLIASIGGAVGTFLASDYPSVRDALCGVA